MKKQQTIWRFGIYLAGMAILAMGLILNTKAGLGSSAIISVPYTISLASGWSLADLTISLASGWSLADLTLITYCVLVLAQFFIKGKNRTPLDLLQIVVSVVFTRFMALFQACVPYQSGFLPTDLLVLVLGLVLTGMGAAMTVDMQLVPNPGDGIVSSISERTGKELGLCKNCVDACCVAGSLVLGAVFGKVLLGVGLGTILSMIGVGRVIYRFNRFARAPLRRKAGLEG